MRHPAECLCVRCHYLTRRAEAPQARNTRSRPAVPAPTVEVENRPPRLSKVTPELRAVIEDEFRRGESIRGVWRKTLVSRDQLSRIRKEVLGERAA